MVSSSSLNLLFVTADQWRADAFGLAAPTRAVTPHLDALAREGVWMARHYGQAAPCGPSRTSIHTARFPIDHGAWRNGAPARGLAANWAASLAAAGREAHLVGYSHTVSDTASDDRGFEGLLPGLVCEAEHRVDQSDWAAWLGARGRPAPTPASRLLDPTPVSAGAHGAYRWGRASYAFADSDTAYLAVRACAFMARRRSKPWALHVTFFRPHDPYVVAEDFPLPSLSAADFPRRGPTRAEALRRHPYLGAQLRAPRAAAPDDPETLLDLRRHYLASVAEFDAGVGLLLDGLQALDLADSTLVIVTSDHGDQLGDHWLMNKLGPYDQSFHVPLIVRDPRREADAGRGRREQSFTQAVDIAPTLLDYAEAEPLPACRGRTLRGLVEGRAEALRMDHALWYYDYSDVMASDGRPHRLSVARSAQGLYAEFDDFAPLLIDLEGDGEDAWLNRSGDRAYEALEAAMRAQLKAPFAAPLTAAW
ncbi:sulfatase-like hydrolase/transferase [Phenylobacterium sp.]|uniref:sulfatase-like hydrolase/transferase n=1 Tax=Phenylobacterium sp. TaxID=1871053 RepID=UPI003BABA136